VSVAEEFVQELRSRYDDEVRAVATYTEDGYEMLYTIEPVDEEYTIEDLTAIHDDVVLQDIEQPFQESLFHDLGDIQGKVRLFDGGTVAHFWPEGDSDGVLVVLGPNADIALRSLLDLAKSYYS